MPGAEPSLPAPPAAFSPENRLAELSILYEVSRALQRTLDEERALYTILVGVTAGHGLGFNRAFLLLLDTDAGLLRGRMAIGPGSPEEASVIWRELMEHHRSLGDLLEALNEAGIRRDERVNEIVARFAIPLSDKDHPIIRVMKSREACRTAGGYHEPHALPAASAVAELLGTAEFAVAPLYMADRELGVLIADNYFTRAPIGLPSLRLLQIYAHEASGAIENCRLYRELLEKVAACESTNRALLQNQKYLLQAERLSAVGKMAALLAHEIRTPLVSIGGFARRLLRRSPTDDARTEELQIIVSEVDRLEKLVREVLGYSRMPEPDLKPVDINALIHTVAHSMLSERPARRIKLTLRLASDLPGVPADEAQMRHALMNLVINAIDAMPAGGILTVATSLQKDCCEICVKDTGVGIVRENWNRLFTPFFTTKDSGTGLGLLIVSQVVNNHKGSIRFESEPGKGTSFYLRFRLTPQPAAAALTGGSSERVQEER